MKQNRIQTTHGIKEVMHALWLKHHLGDQSASEHIFWVDFPEPTEEEKRIMAEYRANRKPVIFDEKTLQTMMVAASEKLGGW